MSERDEYTPLKQAIHSKLHFNFGGHYYKFINDILMTTPSAGEEYKHIKHRGLIRLMMNYECFQEARIVKNEEKEAENANFNWKYIRRVAKLLEKEEKLKQANKDKEKNK